MPTHRVACTILLLTAQVHGAVLFVETCFATLAPALVSKVECQLGENFSWTSRESVIGMSAISGCWPVTGRRSDWCETTIRSIHQLQHPDGTTCALSVIQWSDWLVATLIDAYGARCTAAQCKVQHPQSCWSLSSFSTSVILPLATSTSGLRHLIVPLPLNSTKQFRGGNISVPAYLII